MNSKALVVFASIVALIVTVACGESRPPVSPSPVTNPGPTEPSPNPPTPTPNPPTPTPNPPTPTPNPPTPTPNPPAPTPNPPTPPAPTPGEPLAFTPDAASPGSRSYSLQPAGMIDGDIYVALNGTGFGPDAVNMVRATISYDPAVVTPVSFSSAGSWMEAFGYQSTFKVTKSGSNLVKVSVDMHSTSTGASGSGTIVRLRFRKVGSGSSRLDFTDANAYDSGFNNSLQSTHGGTLIVQ